MKKIPKKIIKSFEEAITYQFKDKDLASTSLTHKSFINESKEEKAKDNERLEFLGDAVLNLLISELLMKSFPDKDEGVLSRKRSSIVSEKSLARLARKIDLGSFIRLGKGEDKTRGREKESILSDAMEAVIGAVYIDGGNRESQKIFSRAF